MKFKVDKKRKTINFPSKRETNKKENATICWKRKVSSLKSTLYYFKQKKRGPHLASIYLYHNEMENKNTSPNCGKITEKRLEIVERKKYAAFITFSPNSNMFCLFLQWNATVT